MNNITLIYLGEAIRIGTVLLCCFCNTHLVYRYFRCLFSSEKRITLGEYAAYALYFLTTAVIYLLCPQTTVVYFIPLLFLCILVQLYPGDEKQKLFYALIFGVVMFFLNRGVGFISGALSGHSLFWTVNGEILNQVFFTVFLFLFVLIFCHYCGAHDRVRLPFFYWGMLLITPCATFALSLYIAGRSLIEPVYAAVFYFVFLLINISSFYLYEKVTAYFAEKTERDILLRQNQYYSSLSEALVRSAERTNSIRHDLKNHAIAMDALIRSGEYDSLRCYLRKTFHSVPGENHPFVTGNAVIDGLLYAKSEEAHSKGIRLDLEIAVPSTLNLSPQLLTVVLGNLLDNAVEAVSGEGVPKEIFLRFVYEKNCVFLEISNPFQKKPHRRSGRFFTTKEDAVSHGYGLRNVEKAVEENGGVMNIITDGERFIVRIVLYDILL